MDGEEQPQPTEQPPAPEVDAGAPDSQQPDAVHTDQP